MDELAALRAQVQELTNETKEALAQQSAIADVLTTIARATSDPQPVFDAILKHAVELCGADHAILRRLDGEFATLVATSRPGAAYEVGSKRRVELTTPGRRIAGGEDIVHIPDMSKASAADQPGDPEIAKRYPTHLGVGVRIEGVLFGWFDLVRSQARPFTDREIALVRSFADQAAIAIENVRLFNETKESLRQQTATSEVLNVISRSVFDLQKVFDTIVENAARLCGASRCGLFRLEDDGLRIAAAWNANMTPERVERDVAAFRKAYNLFGTAGAVGEAVRDGRPVQVDDVQVDPAYEGVPRGTAHTVLAVPLLRDGRAVGALRLGREEVRRFTDREIRLVESFADQAVIAIENVRLFNETKESLDQQSATRAVLEIISASAFDLDKVFTTIVENAVRLCHADNASISVRSGDGYQQVAHAGTIPDLDAYRRYLEGLSARRPGRETLSGRVLLERRTVQIEDVQADPEYERTTLLAAVPGAEEVHTMMGVPIARGDDFLGILIVRRMQVKRFSDREVGILETFAQQAAIAIENVRLFNETKEALERETTTAGVLKIISRSAFDLQHVLDTVINSAVRLTSGATGTIFRLDGDEYVFAATSNPEGPVKDVLERMVVRPEQDTLVTRAARSRRPVQVEDVQAAPAFQADPSRGLSNTHTRLAVPLLREGAPIGILVISRSDIKLFTEQEIELVTTFADQAVVAIENARLVGEIEAASRHKSEFLANMSHELRTPLNAIIGFSDVLDQRMAGELNAKQSEYVQDISSSGKHLLDLVNDILDLSKVEAGRMDLEPSEFALADTVRSALAFVRERAARHGIELDADLAPDLGTITADERKVRQVVLNLLSNAVKFTPDGGWIGVSARRRGGEVTVSVKDTGIGIAPEDQTKVFEEFQQVGKRDDRAREGTGLGLALAKRFIELHGGRIWLESEVGKGTTFTFALPVAIG